MCLAACRNLSESLEGTDELVVSGILNLAVLSLGPWLKVNVLEYNLVEVVLNQISILGSLNDERSVGRNYTRGNYLEVDASVRSGLVQYVNGSIAECVAYLLNGCLEWQSHYVPVTGVDSAVCEGNSLGVLSLGLPVFVVSDNHSLGRKYAQFTEELVVACVVVGSLVVNSDYKTVIVDTLVSAYLAVEVLILVVDSYIELVSVSSNNTFDGECSSVDVLLYVLTLLDLLASDSSSGDGSRNNVEGRGDELDYIVGSLTTGESYLVCTNVNSLAVSNSLTNHK